VTSDTALEKTEIERLYFGLALEAQKQMSFRLQHPKKRIIVIAGPTGCGKSAFAMKLAQTIGGEIISADSMQVYKGMDIGTAKPTLEERASVPHYLVDIRTIQESFNVVDFYYEARQACHKILEREGTPIVVGGSGFYLHALIYGPPHGPPSVPEVRQALEKQMEIEGVEVLYERLRHFDPQYASTINKNDKQKIIRALEIITLTGKKVSKLSWTTRIKPQNYDFRCWFLHRSREHLYQRIEHRCDKMVADGLLHEVECLEKEGLRQNISASQAIGYRQGLDYLASPRTDADHQQFLHDFKQASRKYAKRQLTWFGREALFRWLDVDLHDYEVAIDIIHHDYMG
jgi:tRNA dimethylallyltransferase